MGTTQDGRGGQQVLVRFSGEIGTKARATRSQFVRRLLANLRDAIASESIEPKVQFSHDRIFVSLPKGGAGLDALARVFGVQSISPVEVREGDSLEALCEAGRELFGERVSGKRFAVRARRVGDRAKIPLAPSDVERALGAALGPFADRVDLDHPDVTVHVELIGRFAYFFPDRIACPGGIPVGSGGRAVALMSGGFDSAVAAWQLLRRGVALDYAFCRLGGQTHQQGVLRVAQVLAERWSYGDRPRLHAIDFDPVSNELREHTTPRYWQVLLKRQMMRAGALLAQLRRASALVTGEAVGQVSSQTLPNLAVISRATEATILRPLVGTNKDEIIDTAKRIGTYETSRVVGEYCAMVPTRPATAATLEAIETEEAKLDPSLVETAVREREIFELRGLDVEALRTPDLDVERIPDGAVVVDLRTRDEYRGWHWPDALHLEFGRALAAYGSFDRSQTYVLYCEIGLKSAHLAELMRKEGFTAYHVPRGLATLRTWAR